MDFDLTELITLGTPIADLLLAVIGFIILYIKVETVHLVINSRMDKLLAVTGKAERAEGVLEGEERSASPTMRIHLNIPNISDE